MLEPFNYKLNSFSWLNDLHIDKALVYFQSIYQHAKIYTINDQNDAHGLQFYEHNFYDTDNLVMIVNTYNHWIVVTNIDTQPHQASSRKQIYVYDSLNNPNYVNGLHHMFKYMFPLQSSVSVNKVTTYYPQNGSNDCGLFALCYVQSLCQLQDPSLICYDQSTLRSSYNSFIDCNYFQVAQLANYNGQCIRNMVTYNINID